MLLIELLLERERINIFTFEGIKTITKRTLLLKKLVFLSARKLFLIWRGASIGRLSVIESIETQGANSNLQIGQGSFVGIDCQLALHDEINIGNNVAINSNVKIFTASHDADSADWKTITAPVNIEDYVWIASGATILPGSTIKKGAIIGAGAIISGTINSGDIVVGAPSKVIKKRNTENLDYSPAKFSAVIQAWIGKGN